MLYPTELRARVACYNFTAFPYTRRRPGIPEVRRWHRPPHKRGCSHGDVPHGHERDNRWPLFSSRQAIEAVGGRGEEWECETSGLVGARGFEPPTSCSQSRRATELRYAPTELCSAISCCNNVLAWVKARARWLMRFLTSGASCASV